MTIEHPAELLEDYLDASLAPADARKLERHIQECAQCRAELQGLRSLRAVLARVPAPVPPPGLLENMLAKAIRAPAAPRWGSGAFYRLGLAAAAMLLLAVSFLLGMQIASRQANLGPQVRLAAAPVELGPNVQRVGLVFQASDPIQDARIAVWLPDDVQIAGRPSVRHLSWHTDLKRGANLLELPLTATGTRGGNLIVLLSQGSLIRTLEVPIVVRPTPAGAAHVGAALRSVGTPRALI